MSRHDFSKSLFSFHPLSQLSHREKFSFHCLVSAETRSFEKNSSAEFIFNFLYIYVFLTLHMMFNRKASPTRSAKSGNSVTSSTNSVRSTMSPKVTPHGQSRTSSITSVQKTRPSQPSTLKSQNSKPNSFDEDAPVPEGLVRCGICKRNFAEDRIEKHHVVCQMVKTKKRRVYDASKKRVQVRLKCLFHGSLDGYTKTFST